MKLTVRLGAILACLLLGTPLCGQSRTYAGIFNSRWRTVGLHGHDQPLCAPIERIEANGSIAIHGPDCNPVDFARGNLDDSIGFRAGRERDFLTLGPFAIVGGVEGSLSTTEYNLLTQSDFTFLTVAATTGADLILGGFRVGGRVGVGPFATSDRFEAGFASVRGIHLSIPLGNGVALRVARQTLNVLDPARRDSPSAPRRDPRAAETSMLLVTSPDRRGPSPWEFTAATGTTAPGGSIGSSRGLRKSAYSIVAADRELPWAGLLARISWSAAAEESTLPTTFRGYEGNFRSKTIDAFGVGAGRTLILPGARSAFSVRYGAGLQIADWRDDYQLLTRDGEPLQSGVEVGISVDAALRRRLAPHLAVEVALQRIYWYGIDVGEGRCALGLVVTR